MAIRAAALIMVTSFLLGTFMTHWIADSLVMWKSPLTVSQLHTSAVYYSLLATMPSYMQYVLMALVAFGGITTFVSLSDGEAGNVMFDGASLFLYLMAIVVYATSILPNLSPFSTTDLASLRDKPDFPLDLKTHTIEFASSHLICSVALTGILALQAGRHWVEADDAEEEDEVMRAQREEDPSQGARGRKVSKPTDPPAQVRDTPSTRRKGGVKRKVLAFRN